MSQTVKLLCLVGFKDGESWPSPQPSLFMEEFWGQWFYNLKSKGNKEEVAEVVMLK